MPDEVAVAVVSCRFAFGLLLLALLPSQLLVGCCRFVDKGHQVAYISALVSVPQMEALMDK